MAHRRVSALNHVNQESIDPDELEEIEWEDDESGTGNVSEWTCFDLESHPLSWGLLCGAGSCSIYLAVRTAIFYRYLQSALDDPAQSIQDLSNFASSWISVANASVAALMSLNTIRLKVWNNPIQSKPSVLFLTYCSITGYMVADTIGKVLSWTAFRGTPNEWKMDKVMLFHHLLTGSAVLFQLPKPEYCMLLWGFFLLAECSTIPLSVGFIGKFLKWGPRFQKYCKLAFVICWMLTRVPLCFYALYFSVKYHREIMDRGKVRGMIMGVGNTCGGVLMSFWTFAIIRKLIRHLKGIESVSRSGLK